MTVNTKFFSQNLYELITTEIWKILVPPNEVNNVIKSPKKIIIFLDNNDSDFNVYLQKCLQNKDGIYYYADYYKYKKTQTYFTQNIMSLIFLESKNIKTGRLFAEDVIEKSNKTLSSPQYQIRDRKYIYEFKKIFEIFSSLLYGSGKRKDYCIRLLKGMSCDWYNLNEWFGLKKDFTDPDFLYNFFSNIIHCYDLDMINENINKKMFFCIGNIPHDHFDRYDLDVLIMMLNSDEIFKNIKFIFITKDYLPEMYIRSFNYYAGTRKYVRQNVLIKEFSLLSDEYDIQNVLIKVVNKISNYDEYKKYDKIKEKHIIKLLSETLNEYYDNNISVLTLSQGLTALIGYHLINPEKEINKDAIEEIFYT